MLLSVRNVEKCLQRKVIFRHITDLYMKVSSILVISVIIELQHKVIFSNTGHRGKEKEEADK